MALGCRARGGFTTQTQPREKTGKVCRKELRNLQIHNDMKRCNDSSGGEKSRRLLFVLRFWYNRLHILKTGRVLNYRALVLSQSIRLESFHESITEKATFPLRPSDCIKLDSLTKESWKIDSDSALLFSDSTPTLTVCSLKYGASNTENPKPSATTNYSILIQEIRKLQSVLRTSRDPDAEIPSFPIIKIRLFRTPFLLLLKQFYFCRSNSTDLNMKRDDQLVPNLLLSNQRTIQNVIRDCELARANNKEKLV
ncbi:hypothetical protein TcasGA2_TC007604 [Tribolium castaneum]|uniref:Uncharacterized protein n=1 Tax=Tribolium castaneum TaxID=7070 RepID=D2A2Y4_TRICA|nr:hypothetical protein TcasGA2_TC007604 [Tribolium castaneum]